MSNEGASLGLNKSTSLTQAFAPIRAPKTITGQYLSANFAKQEGDSSSALGYLNEAIGLSGETDALYIDAYSLALDAGDIDLANHFASKIEQQTQNVVLSPRLLQAVVALKNLQYKEAEALLDKAPESGVGQIVVGLLKAWVSHAQKQPVPAEDLAELVKQSGQFELLIKYQLAILLEAMGSDAATYYDDLAKMPYVPEHVLLKLASHYQHVGDDRKLEQLLERHQSNSNVEITAKQLTHSTLSPIEGAAEVFFGIGQLLVSLDAFHAAEVPLNLAHYLRPNFPSNDFVRAQLIDQSGDKNHAIEAYQKLEKNPAYRRVASLQLAYLHQDAKDIPAALEKITELSQNYPENLNIWLAKGDILRADQHYEDAADAYGQGITTIKQKKAEHWPAFYSRAIAFERAGDWERAEEDFLEALRLQPDQPEVLNYLGYSWLIQNRQLSQAKAMIEKAVRARPRDAHIIDSMGWAFYRLGEYDKAIAYLERAVDLSPRDATVNEHLGDVYWRMGYKLQARYQWERALAFNPTEAGQEEGLKGKIASGLPAADVPKTDVMQANISDDAADQQRAEIQTDEEKAVE